jgi:hypothetical protein
MSKRPSDAISYQVSVSGRGLQRMTHNAMRQMVEHALDGGTLPKGLDVRIQCWRAGRELDMGADNARATVLRETFRRLLHAGRIALAVRDGETDDE